MHGSVDARFEHEGSDSPLKRISTKRFPIGSLARGALALVALLVPNGAFAQQPPADPPDPAAGDAPLPIAPAPPPPPPPVPPAAPPPAVFEPTNRIAWNEAWPRFRPAEYVYTAAAITGALIFEYATNGAPSSNWSGPILFDAPVRSALVLGTPAARDRANNISDITTAIPQLYPAIVDPLLTPLLLGGTWDVSWQMEMMYLETMGTSFFLARVGERYVARTRPAKLECNQNSGYSDRCEAGPYASFPSGHSLIAFAGAGLVCAHHQNMPLYGGGYGDALACGVMLGTATTTAVLRMMADRHYISDVIAGTVLGVATGYAMPQLLHYHWPFAATSTRVLPGARVAAFPTASTESVGMTVQGLFLRTGPKGHWG